MFARNGNSVGVNLCPRPCRGRKATRTPSSVPTMNASDGAPKGVSTRTSSTSCNSDI
jgi:hypothetical protein